MRLVFVTQVLDPEHPVLGFVVRWVQALAERCDRLDVVANEARPAAVPPNVRVVSLGKERDASRLERGLAYQRFVFGMRQAPRPDAYLAHMCPIYLDLAAPVTKALRIPSILWYAHPSVTPVLRVADRLADAVVTSLPGAYPFPGPKVRIVGQATDVERLEFTPPPAPAGELRLVAVGRTSPSKGFDTVIRGIVRAREAGVAATLRIVGPSTTPAEHRHREELERLAEGSNGAAVVEDGVAPARVPEVIAQADALVNAMVAGSGDKVVFEAMALGRPVLASNPAFEPLLAGLPLELTFRPGDAADLAWRLTAFAASSRHVREEVARELRARVERDHSLETWVDRVIALVEELRGGRR